MTLIVLLWVRLVFALIHGQSLWIVPLLIFSLILADLVSGLVHWAADTWGNVQWPVLGASLIRSFREHHLDQTLITQHDWSETNGDNCLIILPVLAILLCLPIHTPVGLRIATLGVSFCSFVILTNQIHQWAHRQTCDLPSWVLWLQKKGVILSVKSHAQHHQYPYTQSYCITSGWSNSLLDRTGFFRALEKVITRVTGWIPREDDLQESGDTHD